MRVQISSKQTLSLFVSFLLWCFSAEAVWAQAPAQDTSASFESLAKSATTAREGGRTEEAIREYGRALEIRPEWSEGWWYLGTLEYDSDQFSQAIPAFQKLVQLAPGAGAGWNFLGLCEFETKDYGNSLEHLKKGQNLGDGDDPEISRVSKYHLALLLIRSGDFDQATTLLAATFGQGQMSAQIKAALGLAILRAPLLPEEIDPSQDALVHATGEAAALFVQGNTDKALDSFHALLRDYPDTPYLRYACGRMLTSAERLDEALLEHHEELRVSPGSPLPWIEISQLQTRLKHPQEAVRAAEEAVRLAPDSSAAHLRLGRALLAAGTKQRAAVELEAVEKFAPEKIRPEERILRLYAHHGASGGARGVSTAPSPDDRSSASFEQLARRAAESQTAGNADMAVQTYREVLQLRPEWDDGRWNLAMLLYSAARYPEAISELKSFVERKPNFGTAWAVMGLSDFETRDYRNALIHLQRGEELGFGGAPEAVRFAKYHLAMLLNRDSQFERATQTLAPEAGSNTLTKEIYIVLGLALLRMPLLPEQVEPAKNFLVQTAGEIAALLQKSKYDLAFPKFELLLKEYPATPFLHYAYGTAFVALSQYDEAEKQMREELKVSPESELPYLRLASMALKKRQPGAALPFAQKAVQLAAGSAEGHYLLGRVSLELGLEGTAVRELEAASRLAPGSPEVHFNLAKAYARAKLPEKAEQERAIFARLNALAEQQRSRSGSQAYGGSHNAADFTPARPETDKTVAPQRP